MQNYEVRIVRIDGWETLSMCGCGDCEEGRTDRTWSPWMARILKHVLKQET